MNDDDVRALARLAGVETEYWDVQGRLQEASVESLRTVLGCMKFEFDGGERHFSADAISEYFERRADASPVVIWEGDRIEFEVAIPPGCYGEPRATVVLEDGTVVDLGGSAIAQGATPSRRWLAFNTVGGLPIGYHQITIDWNHGTIAEPVVRALWIAPRRVIGPSVLDRWWGVFSPLYAMGTGNASPSVLTLDRIGRWIDGFGGRVVATLPLLSGFIGYRGEPYDPSPYAPVSRAHWNELYLDLGALGIDARLGLRSGPERRFPYRELARLRRARVENALGERLTQLALSGTLSDYARFRAAVERRGAPWTTWPDPARNGELEPGRDFDPAVAAFHEFCQRALVEQLAELSDRFRRREQRLYLDLPLGAHPFGYETWRQPGMFAQGVAVGAPPDEFFEAGQDWGFPPLVPAAASADGHSLFRTVVARHCEVAGVLRIDHVMGLYRLFWIPQGAEPKEGVYVRYPMSELFAVLAIESARHDCFIVGEDLGTVPDEIREGMARHDLLGMYVAQFHVPSSPGVAMTPPWQRSVASVDTHDTPTFAGWVAGRDIDHRLAMGLLTSDAAQRARSYRAQQVANLRESLCRGGWLGNDFRAPPAAAAVAAGSGERQAEVEDAVALHAALLRLLGDSDASLALVTLEDLWAETEPQNIPGTSAERPNWVQMFPMGLDDLLRDDAVAAVFHALQEARLGSHLRARHQYEGIA
ncbi:MAG: 4-alpha-glucanotransferase [Acidimicrobiales bacterium]|nr:4-alpha-glucanotransferase [Acidimicrobiales bacterium]